ncbi:hypothetical protein WA026_002921 [Henosepilachna vigintioctopunctata]|uniref:Odorant receptor n=1 Tax=Henosepilachna vigintioctopunctata TaxID=420089 RepID=A0AAW1TGX6_9CUCU
MQVSICAVLAFQKDAGDEEMFLGSRFYVISRHMILLTGLAYLCDGVVKEAENIMITCISFFTQASLSKTGEEEVLEKNLRILCRNVERRMPKFSAAGVFSINVSMLGLLVGCIISNMVIIIQYIQSGINEKMKISCNLLKTEETV